MPGILAMLESRSPWRDWLLIPSGDRPTCASDLEVNVQHTRACTMGSQWFGASASAGFDATSAFVNHSIKTRAS
jgi:hypothetical protein